MVRDPLIISISSELLVNLAAGWLGAALIGSGQSRGVRSRARYVVPTNIAIALLLLFIAYMLEKQGV